MLDDLYPPPGGKGQTGPGDALDGAPKARSKNQKPLLLPGLVKRLPPPPGFLMAPLLQAFVTSLLKRHPQMFERLGDYGERRFLIDPVDLPFVLMLVPSLKRPLLIMKNRGAPVPWQAAVRGPALALLAMAQGEADGDALFFTRDIVIEGDTEAVLALRNALDDAALDLFEEFEAAFGPLSGAMRRLRPAAVALFEGLRRALTQLERLKAGADTQNGDKATARA